jgi:hypothetical protein
MSKDRLDTFGENDNAATPKVVFGGQCCLCGFEIEATGMDPCEVTVTTASGKWQVWWCHGACFKAAITDPPDAPGFFEPAHF